LFNVFDSSEIDTSPEILAIVGDETGTGALTFATAPTFTTSITIGSAGASFADDGDGAITITGLGNGSDENLIINLDDTSNTISLSSSTGVTEFDLGTMDMNTDTLDLTGTGTINGLDAIDGTTETTLETYLDIAGEVTSTGLGTAVIADNVTVSGWTMQGTTTLGVLAGSIDAGSATYVEIPNGAAPTTTIFGQIAGDNNAWGTGRGAAQFFDGTANTWLIGALASDTPADGEVPVWNTGGTITWETVSGDVTGAGSSTDSAIVLFDGTDGATLKNSDVTIDSDGNISTPGYIETGTGGTEPLALALPYGGAFTNASNNVGLTNDLPVVFNSNVVMNASVTFNTIPTVPANSFALGTSTTGSYAAGDAEAGGATKITNGSSDATLSNAGEMHLNTTDEQLSFHSASDGEISGEASISLLQHRMWVFDPDAVCDGTIDRLFLMTVGDDLPEGMIIDEWKVSFEADPTTEVDLDLKYANAFIGVASATVIDVLDTTAGVSSEDTDANINGGSAIANGKVLYLEFGTAYTETGHQIIFEIWYHAEED
jgi:hypothetical protein